MIKVNGLVLGRVGASSDSGCDGRATTGRWISSSRLTIVFIVMMVYPRVRHHSSS